MLNAAGAVTTACAATVAPGERPGSQGALGLDYPTLPRWLAITDRDIKLVAHRAR